MRARRRPSERLFPLLLALPGLLGAGPRDDDERDERRPQRLRHPNVVLILADDLGSGDLGVNGGLARTPHLDRLVREGVVLERFYTAPVCSPTRAALLSGRSPIHLGLQYTVLHPWGTRGLPGTAYTIAERFRDAGYQTGIVGKWHLGGRRSEHHPNLQGFDHFFGSLATNVDYFSHEQIYGFGHDLQRNGQPVHDEGYLTRRSADEAIRFVRRRDRHRPFLLYLPFHAPHVPHQAPAETLARYRGPATGLAALRAAMVDELDQAIGRILGALARERLRSDTIVVFLSDNGADTHTGANRPLRGGKLQVFEGGIRVPALIHWPERLAPGRSSQRMRDSDLFATLEAAAGLPLRAPAESRNLWPVLRGAPEQTREPFFFAVDRTDGSTHKAVLDGRWKLVVGQNVGVETPLGPLILTVTQLFDVENDPAETWSVVAEERAIARDLAAQLRAWEGLYPEDGIRGGVPGWIPPWWFTLRADFTEYLQDPEVLEAELRARRPRLPFRGWRQPRGWRGSSPWRELERGDGRRGWHAFSAGRSPRSRARRDPD